MKTHRITAAGQLSIPADVRRRWGTHTVSLEDLGDALVLRPLPDDPVAAARGSLRGKLRPTTELRRVARGDEAASRRSR